MLHYTTSRFFQSAYLSGFAFRDLCDSVGESGEIGVGDTSRYNRSVTCGGQDLRKFIASVWLISDKS